MAEDRFESGLRAIGQDIEWPATPDFAKSIGHRLASGSPRGSWWRRRSLAYAIAAAILLGVALAALPPTREAIAGWFGLTHVTLRRVPVLPTPAPSDSISGARTEVGLAEAKSRAGFKVLVPSAVVSAVYLVDRPPQREVQMELAGGVQVTESGGTFDERFLGKVIGPGTEVTSSQVRGRPGAWIHGPAHEVAFLDSSGNFRIETLRVVGNVLIWEEGGVVLRVEGAASEQAALTIASGLR